MAFLDIIGGAVKLNTGHYLPMIGLGTYKITGQDSIDLVVESALKSGYRMFDTAKYYLNEKELGNAFKFLPKYGLKRTDVFITTKFFPAVSDNRRFARKMVTESLENLQTDYIDLVLIHFPKASDSLENDPRNPTNRKDAYLELETLKEEKKVLSVGVSNYEVQHIEEIKSFGKSLPYVNQIEFHPHFTRTELHEYCKKEGIFLQAYSSLGRNHPDLIDDPAVKRIAASHQTSPQMILLAWPLHLGVGIIPKSSSPSRIADNMKVVDVKLSDEEVKELSALNRNKNYIRCQGWLVF